MRVGGVWVCGEGVRCEGVWEGWEGVRVCGEGVRCEGVWRGCEV